MNSSDLRRGVGEQRLSNFFAYLFAINVGCYKVSSIYSEYAARANNKLAESGKNGGCVAEVGKIDGEVRTSPTVDEEAGGCGGCVAEVGKIDENDVIQPRRSIGTTVTTVPTSGEAVRRHTHIDFTSLFQDLSFVMGVTNLLKQIMPSIPLATLSPPPSPEADMLKTPEKKNGHFTEDKRKSLDGQENSETNLRHEGTRGDIFAANLRMRQTNNVLRDRAIYTRWFTSDARPSVNKIDDISKPRPLNIKPEDKIGIRKFSAGTFGSSHQSVNKTLVSSMRMNKGNGLWITSKVRAPATGFLFNSQPANLVRRFSTDSGQFDIGILAGNIARWLKKEGDKVSPGEVLCEVETDKATVEMECMEEGYLAKILRGDGSSGIKVGELCMFAQWYSLIRLLFHSIISTVVLHCHIIAITVEEEDDVAKFKDYTPTSDATPTPAPKAPSSPSPPKQEVAEAPAASPEPKGSKPSAPSSAGDRIFASPLARKLAEDHNISLSNIKGTGPDGRIVKADIEDYLASRGKEVSQAPKVDTASATLDYVDIPHSQIRKVSFDVMALSYDEPLITASRLLQSKQTIPHYYLTVDTCVDKLMELRVRLNSIQEASGGKRISVNDLVIKAAALALRKVPQCNSSWTNEYIRQYHNVNINVAVQTENGLYVPVIRDADKKGLSKISDEVKHLAQKAKENSLKPEDYEGGTFTVSNLGGPFGIKQFCAIINPPQAGILAVGSAEKRVIPGAGPDQYAFASFMSVTLSCDHRVIDGAIGAEWLKAFKGYVENPESMLL
ncbi:dihydrolipoyllysine-residue acetyltransferase component 2 of pyruvate dehydrogenase complex [Striga asiatica]|uniref:Dihydrolipoamide acetyltransferase component of pyruvate dehydrogenase complex n=1 Tax=Striga asiatica TaxID=4170 RepID=A0A5A7P6G9_STRAF|nr:dihydrolipoyllysine-residue acetyltransferase component 2 of pyruvate dehydrogenase complex [Striga asiatica]